MKNLIFPLFLLLVIIFHLITKNRYKETIESTLTAKAEAAMAASDEAPGEPMKIEYDYLDGRVLGFTGEDAGWLSNVKDQLDVGSLNIVKDSEADETGDEGTATGVKIGAGAAGAAATAAAVKRAGSEPKGSTPVKKPSNPVKKPTVAVTPPKTPIRPATAPPKRVTGVNVPTGSTPAKRPPVATIPKKPATLAKPATPTVRPTPRPSNPGAGQVGQVKRPVLPKPTPAARPTPATKPAPTTKPAPVAKPVPVPAVTKPSSDPKSESPWAKPKTPAADLGPYVPTSGLAAELSDYGLGFKGGKADILEDDAWKITAAANAIKADTRGRVIHLYSFPDPGANGHNIGKSRAEAIYKKLLELGAPQARLKFTALRSLANPPRGTVPKHGSLQFMVEEE